MICAVQTFGDLINYHPHIHTVSPEGIFTESGYFVHIPYVCRLQAVEIWKEKVFDFLVEEGRIDRETVAMIRSWRHTGFTATIRVAALRVPIPSGCSSRIHALRVSVDNTVRIEADDQNGMQRLIEYISRCPFSLARMVSRTGNGKILYRASKPGCIPFPKQGAPELDIGIPRNYEIFNPLDFLAAVTQHIPNKGEHQIRYYGWYSNKRRGMRKSPQADSSTFGPDEYWEKLESDTAFRKKCRMTWATLIKCVYEVDPLTAKQRRSQLPQLWGNNEGHLVHRATSVRDNRKKFASLRYVEGDSAESTASRDIVSLPKACRADSRL